MQVPYFLFLKSELLAGWGKIKLKYALFISILLEEKRERGDTPGRPTIIYMIYM